MINEIKDNKLMELFYNMIPCLDHFLGSDLVFTISNKEHFLLVKDREEIRMAAKTGHKIPEGCAADVCLKKQKSICNGTGSSLWGTFKNYGSSCFCRWQN